MNSTIQMKKSNLLEVLATTENEDIINLLCGLMRGYQKKTGEAPVKIITKEEELKYTEAIAKNKIKQAAHTLDGELFEIRRNLNKTLFLLQELQEDYFYELDARKDEDQKEILYGYEKASMYTEIIFDNSIAIEKILNYLDKTSKEK